MLKSSVHLVWYCLRTDYMNLRYTFKSFPSLVKLKRLVISLFDFSCLNIVAKFKAFAPNSAGNYRTRARQAVSTINNFPSAMIEFLEGNVKSPFRAHSISDFLQSESNEFSSGKLGDLFLEFGSDKSSIHNYDLVYEKIIGDPMKVSGILEIGLGTNNTKIISTMGSEGKPGASLRAFRNYCPNAQIFGADIDRDILFNEERIQTFFVDQLDSKTLKELHQKLPSNLDLIIDDGLHSIDANLRVMTFALPLLKVGGWLVIEDVSENSLELWQLVSMLIPSDFRSSLILAKNGFLFLVQRL